MSDTGDHLGASSQPDADTDIAVDRREVLADLNQHALEAFFPTDYMRCNTDAERAAYWRQFAAWLARDHQSALSGVRDGPVLTRDAVLGRGLPGRGGRGVQAAPVVAPTPVDARQDEWASG